MLYDYQPAIEKELQTTLEQLQDDPLWSRLEAVERDEVYSVASYWLGSGPLAANAVIDDLYQVFDTTVFGDLHERRMERSQILPGLTHRRYIS
jgi:ABC-type Fe3+-hydroxamate transport system substrate-binding protein